MSEPRPYHLVPRRELDALRDALRRGLTAWSSAWSSAWSTSQEPCRIGSVEIFAPEAHGEEEGPVRLYRAGRESWCAVLNSPAMNAALVCAVFDSDASMQGDENDHTLVSRVVEEALEDLVTALLGTNETTSAASEASYGLPNAAARPGAGCIRVELEIADISLACVVSHTVLDAHGAASSDASRGSGQPLHPLRQALGKELVTGTLHLGSVEISVQDLMSLHVDDVLALDRHIDEPARFRLDDSPLSCEAFLGAMDGKKALRIVSADTEVDTPSDARTPSPG